MRRPGSTEFALLAGIGVTWGSQFILNEYAIRSVPPLTVAAARVAIGAITLALLVAIMPRRPAGATGRESPARHPWGLYLVIGLTEATLPCFLLPWGQQFVTSSVAAILMATIPLFTLVLAVLFVADEHWSISRVASVLAGFLGVVILVGPEAMAGPAPGLAGAGAILGAAFSFAVSMVLIRRLPPVSPALAMRNIMLVAAAPMLLAAVIIDRPWTILPDTAAMLSVLLLGVFCGGLVYLMVFVLIQRAGPTFTSLSNYLVTLVGVFIGILFLGDALRPHQVAALVVILGALALAHRPPRRAPLDATLHESGSSTDA